MRFLPKRQRLLVKSAGRPRPATASTRAAKPSGASKRETDAAYHDGRFGASQQEPQYRALLHGEWPKDGFNALKEPKAKALRHAPACPYGGNPSLALY
jgi:hypothetical protein